MKRIDSNRSISNVVGEEASMVILSSCLAVLIILQLVKRVLSLTPRDRSSRRKRNTAIADDDDDLEGDVLSMSTGVHSGKEAYGDTVVLMGPSGAGKTTMFYNLFLPESAVPFTVTSLKANSAVLQLTDGVSEKRPVGVRIIDYPGHPSLSAQLPSLLQPPANGVRALSSTTRAVLVVDSTKPVNEAASILYNSVFCNKTLLEAWQKRNTNNGTKEMLHIMVACNKSDAANAKNWRRIKIQLRSELENLRKVSSLSQPSVGDAAVDSTLASENTSIKSISGLLGKNIDLDDLGPSIPLKMHFISVCCHGSSGDDDMKALRSFTTRGEVLTDSSAILKTKTN